MDGTTALVPMLQVRKLRHREGRWLAQDRTASELGTRAEVGDSDTQSAAFSVLSCL